MILTIKELKATIASDKERMGFGKKQRSILKEWLKGNIDDVRLMLLIIYLRKYEYVVNKYKGKGLLGNFLYLYYKHKYYWKCKSRNIFISPNCIEGGVHIVHSGYRWIDESTKIGSNCTILPRVLLGKKRPGIKPPCIFIGDNCYIGTGATILGPVHIGNNVVIGAGAVVTKDIPDDCVVVGNPATIIRKINS